MKEREYMNNHYTEGDEYLCPFKEMAEDPRYLYVHVSVFYAWGLRDHRKYDFLYDSKWHSAVCRNAKNGKRVRLPLFRNSISPNKMFRRKPRINWSYCDVTFYFVTMKSGSRERELTIASPDKELYKPFYWILDTIEKDYGGHPRIQRWAIGFFRFLCRILRPFNIGWVKEIEEDIMPKKEADENVYREFCQLAFEMKEKASSLRSQLDKFDLAVAPGSRPPKPANPKNLGRKKNNLPRKRPPHR